MQKRLQKRVYAKVTKTHLEIQERIRAKADALLDVLEELALSDTSSENARLAAVQQLMDRAYGKATQTNVNANLDSDAKPKDISTRELDKRIEETLERVERVTGGVQEEAESPERSIDIRKYN